MDKAIKVEVATSPLTFQRALVASIGAAVVTSWILFAFGVPVANYFASVVPAILSLGFLWRGYRTGSALADAKGLTLTTSRGVVKVRAADIDTVDLQCDTDAPTDGSAPRVYEARVTFADARGTVLAQVRTGSLTDAKALVDALASDRRSRRTFSDDERRLALPRREQAVAGATLAVSMLTAVAFIGPFMAMLALFFAPVIASVYRSARRVVVGEEGFVVRAPLFSRFVSYGEVAAIEANAGWVWVRLESGDHVELPIKSAPSAVLQREELKAALTEALGRYRASKGPAPSLELALVDNANPYRAPEPTTEALLDVVENPSLPIDTRVQAARVLTRVDPSVGGDAVRAAAGRAADDEARRALEEAAVAEVEEAPVGDHRER